MFLLVGIPTMYATSRLPAPVGYFFFFFGCLAPTAVYLLLSMVWPQLRTGAWICGGISVVAFLITLWGVLTRSLGWTLLLTAVTLIVAFYVGLFYVYAPYEKRRDAAKRAQAQQRGRGPTAG